MAGSGRGFVARGLGAARVQVPWPTCTESPPSVLCALTASLHPFIPGRGGAREQLRVPPGKAETLCPTEGGRGDVTCLGQVRFWVWLAFRWWVPVLPEPAFLPQARDWFEAKLGLKALPGRADAVSPIFPPQGPVGPRLRCALSRPRCPRSAGSEPSCSQQAPARGRVPAARGLLPCACLHR